MVRGQLRVSPNLITAGSLIRLPHALHCLFDEAKKSFWTLVPVRRRRVRVPPVRPQHFRPPHFPSARALTPLYNKNTEMLS
jgi:hypothetical protein